MHILVVNDDGPPSNQSSPYVHSLISTLQSAGHLVSVVLPHTQRSWISKAHIVGAVVKPSYFRPGTLHKDDGIVHPRSQPADSTEEEWILIDGTPASCVQVGLYHFFEDRGPVDLVISGPNYGRNVTAVFSLSSGTLGGALEAAICRKKAVALSYAFFSRVHDPDIIASASRVSVKLIEHLSRHWHADADLYSINVPLVRGVEDHKILYTRVLQNYWTANSSFQEVDADNDDDDPVHRELEIRQEESHPTKDTGSKSPRPRYRHRHFKWAPRFSDVYDSVKQSEPGNDGWAIQEEFISVTPLKANFMQATGLEGEIKLDNSSQLVTPSGAPPDKLYALIKYEDAYVQPLIFSALEKGIYSDSYRLIDSLDELPTQNARLLQISSYETISFDHLVEHAESSLANAYIIRKGLIRKHYLAATGRQWISKHPESVLKDHLLPTLELELDFAEFLDEALLEAYELHDAFRRNEGKSPEERDWWILKPGMSDGGRDIRLFSTEDELREIFEEWETTTSVDSQDDENAAGEAHTSPDSVRGTACPSDGTMVSQLRHFIVQPYIHAPLLFPSSPRKFHIRAYVLAVASLRVYVYRPMLALFATAPYMHPGSTSRNDQIHLTNTCLDDTPTEGRVQCFWDLPAAPALGTTWKEDVFDQIGAVTAEIFEAAARGMMVHFQTLPNVFEIFGVDFLVDESGTAWLLEVNAFPDFKQTGDELKGLVAGLFEDTVTVAVAGFFPGCGRSDEAVGRRLRKVLDLDLGRR